MPTVYDTHVATGTPTAGGARVKLFNANSNRVALIIACGGSVAVNGTAFISTKSNSSGDFLWFAPGTTEKLTYRDYGPLIQEEIWCQVNQNSATFTANEIVKVPKAV